MPKELKVGVVGCGFATKVFHAPLLAGTPGLKLVAMSSSDPAKVAADWPEVAVESSPEALFARPDLDLVVIPTPNASHYPLAKAALAAGKHVVVDKPFTLTLAEARSLKTCAERAGRLLSVFQNRRWDGDFLTVKALLASGELGRIGEFASHFDRHVPKVRDRWREGPELGCGLWYDLGAHLVDQATQLFGVPEALTVDLARQREGARTDDYFQARLHYGQVRVVLHASNLIPLPGPRFIIHGSRASYVKYGLDTQEDLLKAGGVPPLPGWGIDQNAGSLTANDQGVLSTRVVTTLRGDYPAYYAAVRDAIHGAGANPVPVEQAIQTMGLIELGVRSAAEGRTLAVLPEHLSA
jgi:predicted dehydrogenase